MSDRRSRRTDEEWDVYALAAAPQPRRMRVAGRTLRVFVVGPIAVIVARARSDSMSTEDALRAQHAVVVALADRIDPLLPARYGSRMNATRLEAVIRPATDVLMPALEHVRGRQQMTVRLMGPPMTGEREPLPSSGTDYLALRLAQAQATTSDAARLRAVVAPFVVDERIMPGRGGIRATIFHLVARQDVERYKSAAENIGSSMAPLTVRITGPWPVFAFAPELSR